MFGSIGTGEQLLTESQLPGAEEFVQSMADEAVSSWRQREAVPWSAWKMLGHNG